MLKSYLIVTAVLIGGLLTGVARASETTDVRAQLTANYAAFTKAFQDQDIDAIAKMMTPDYSAVGPDGGTSDRKQVLADLKQRMAMMTNVTWTRTITKLDNSKDDAVATVDGDFKGTTTGKDGKTHQIELAATTVDRWIPMPDGWELQHSQVQKVQFSMDGKPMDAH